MFKNEAEFLKLAEICDKLQEKACLLLDTFDYLKKQGFDELQKNNLDWILDLKEITKDLVCTESELASSIQKLVSLSSKLSEGNLES